MGERGHPSPRPADEAATAAPAFRLAEPCVVSTDSVPAPSRRRRPSEWSGGARRPPAVRRVIRRRTGHGPGPGPGLALVRVGGADEREVRSPALVLVLLGR